MTHFFFLFLTALIVSGSLQKEDVMKMVNSEMFVEELKADEELQITLATDYAFHHLINSYRRQLGKDSLQFDDALWFAAHNHVFYNVTNKLGPEHYQSKAKKSFTGRTAMDRIAFVLEKEVDRYNLVAENCTQTFPVELDEDEFSGKTEEEILRLKLMNAQANANAAFESWKASKPHRDTMLDKLLTTHGTSILVDSENCNGTSVFKKQKSSPSAILKAIEEIFTAEQLTLLRVEYEK